jgi:hypothetical protein
MSGSNLKLRVAAFSCVLALGACRSSDSVPSDEAKGALSAARPAPSAPGAPSAFAAEPPLEAFRLEPWVSPRKGIDPVTPPESLLRPWRAFVNQERPRQKKNPRWQSLPPKEAVFLEMQGESAFRCLVNPLEIGARTDEDETEVEAWVLMRRMRCSSDGWATWAQVEHTVLVDLDGKERPLIDHGELFLRERREGAPPRETTVFLRSDEIPKGLATTGPPRVLGPGTDDATPSAADPG